LYIAGKCPFVAWTSDIYHESNQLKVRYLLNRSQPRVELNAATSRVCKRLQPVAKIIILDSFSMSARVGTLASGPRSRMLGVEELPLFSNWIEE
jgi:hypothetical protein